MLSRQFILVGPLILDQVGCLRVRARLEASANSNQIRYMHVRRQRIAAGFPDLALDVHRGWLDGVWILVNQQAIARLQDDVLDGISLERLVQADAEDFELAVRQVTEDLRIRRLRV